MTRGKYIWDDEMSDYIPYNYFVDTFKYDEDYIGYNFFKNFIKLYQYEEFNNELHFYESKEKFIYTYREVTFEYRIGLRVTSRRESFVEILMFIEPKYLNRELYDEMYNFFSENDRYFDGTITCGEMYLKSLGVYLMFETTDTLRNANGILQLTSDNLDTVIYYIDDYLSKSILGKTGYERLDYCLFNEK